MSLSRAVEALWWRRDEPLLARIALAPLSLLAFGYRAGAALARLAARPLRVGVPVLSVGNLCAGGSGKTPVALALCQRLRSRGLRPALLSRGHGGKGGAVRVVSEGGGALLPASVAGDEPVLIAGRCPGLLVLAGPSRSLLAREAVRRGAQVLVLDDGLQHHRLHRDLDVVVVDAQNPLGNGGLLPRGPLREGPSAFARLGSRGLLWFTGADGARSGARGEALLAAARAAGMQGPVESTVEHAGPSFAGEKVFLLAGIARPERFAQTVRSLGAEVAGEAFFADHHRFSPDELRRVQARAAVAGAARILTTEKDFARLDEDQRGGLTPLRIDLRILRGEALLDAALDAILSRAPPPPSPGRAQR
ncbi:MAG: tetraacyldisaccharide 4'-kinase [Myxococcales bacterium]